MSGCWLRGIVFWCRGAGFLVSDEDQFGEEETECDDVDALEGEMPGVCGFFLNYDNTSFSRC